MDNMTITPAELLDDEIVCFLADRYHATSPDIVRTYLTQDGLLPPSVNADLSFRLEENEMEMMRGLTANIE